MKSCDNPSRWGGGVAIISAIALLRRAAGTGALCLTFAAGMVAGQESAVPQADTPAQAVAIPAETAVAAGTVIEIRIDEPVNSKTHKTGDWYAISLSQPILLGERTIVPAGTPGRGQVIHAAKSSWGGKAGELILGARYLEYEGRQIPLRGMKLGALGGNNESLAFASGLFLSPLPLVINGKNADIPAGALATAKLATAIDAGPSITAEDSAATTEADSTQQTGE